MSITIIFDLDGTLVDTAPDLVAALNHVLAGQGLAPVPFAEARAMIGGGGRRMIERALEAERRPSTPAEIERLFGDFIAFYRDHIADGSRPFPGVEAALDELAAQKANLVVCTNKLEGLARQLLDALDLSRRFSVVCGQDTFGIQKPDPDMLRQTIGKAGGRADRAVMVGDSDNDVRAARAARVPVVAVDFGYTEIPVSDLGPDRIISHFDALPRAIRELMPN